MKQRTPNPAIQWLNEHPKLAVVRSIRRMYGVLGLTNPQWASYLVSKQHAGNMDGDAAYLDCGSGDCREAQ